MSEHLTAKNISYEQSPTFALQDISIDFLERKITTIIGPNGSGKSTLLKVLTNLIKPDNGTVLINNEVVSKMKSKALAKKMTMLSQVQSNHLDLSVRDLVTHGRMPHRKWYEKMIAEDEDMIDWAISMTNISHMQHKSLSQLSGGERQRAWIAMAVVQSPDILLLDEPTTYLDISHQLEIMDLVEHLNQHLSMTIIMVLHDINQAAKYSDHLIVMKNGAVWQSGKPREILTRTLFRDVFHVHAKIMTDNGVPSFTPKGLIKGDARKVRHAE